MYFPSLQETNEAIQPFGLKLTQIEDCVELDGPSNWRAWRAGSVFDRFDTLGHFWAEWCWYVAFALENERKRQCFMAALMIADLNGQVELILSLEDYDRRKPGFLTTLFEGPAVTMENIPEDWSLRLLECWHGEGAGAIFGGGKLFRAIRNHAPGAAEICFSRHSRGV